MQLKSPVAGSAAVCRETTMWAGLGMSGLLARSEQGSLYGALRDLIAGRGSRTQDAHAKQYACKLAREVRKCIRPAEAAARWVTPPRLWRRASPGVTVRA